MRQLVSNTPPLLRSRHCKGTGCTNAPYVDETAIIAPQEDDSGRKHVHATGVRVHGSTARSGGAEPWPDFQTCLVFSAGRAS